MCQVFRETGVSEKTVYLRRAGLILAEIEHQTRLYQSKHNVGITLKPHSPLDIVDRLSELKCTVEHYLAVPPVTSGTVLFLKNTTGYLVAMMAISETDPAYLFEEKIIGHEARVLAANPNIVRPCEHCESFGLDMDLKIIFDTFPASLTSYQAERKEKFEATMIQSAETLIRKFSMVKRDLKREFAATGTGDAAQWKMRMAGIKKYMVDVLAMLKGDVPDADCKRISDELKAFREELMSSLNAEDQMYGGCFLIPLLKEELYVRYKNHGVTNMNSLD